MTSVKIKSSVVISDRTKRIFSEIAKRSLSNLHPPSKDRFTLPKDAIEDCSSLKGCRNLSVSYGSVGLISFSPKPVTSSLGIKKRSFSESGLSMNSSNTAKAPKDEVSDLASGCQSISCATPFIAERDQCSSALEHPKRRRHGKKSFGFLAEIDAKEQSGDSKIRGSRKKQRRSRKRGNKQVSVLLGEEDEMKTKDKSDESGQNSKLQIKDHSASGNEDVAVERPATISLPAIAKQVSGEGSGSNERLCLKKEVFARGAGVSKLGRRQTPERKQLRPNFFLAVRMKSPVLKKNVGLLQETIIAYDQRFGKAMVPIATLHLTILVLYIKDREEEDHVKQLLDACSHDLNRMFTPDSSTLIFQGVGNFRDSVVFVPLNNSPGKTFLYDVEKLLRKALEENGVIITDNRLFNPHLTVLKLSRNMAYFKQNNINKIPRHLYHTFDNQEFGRDSIESILLCSMSEKNDDGFYKFLHKVELGQQQVFEDKREASLSESWDIILENEVVEDNAVMVPIQRDNWRFNFCTIL